jgi:glycosyltransferase involved in cell wall biosynthesis
MKYSAVIPIFNEEGSIIPLCDELNGVMAELSSPYEIILVDDGSTDGSYHRMLEARDKYPAIKILKFSRNFGQTAAFWMGIHHSRGEIIITMDGDGQNDPRDIPRMIPLLGRYDLVCGHRRERKDGLGKRWQGSLANFFRNLVLHDGVKDTGCSLKVFKTPRIGNLPFFDGLHRFIPALLKSHGYTIGQVDVNHRPRIFGRSKYGLRNRMIRSLPDLLAVRWMMRRRLVGEVEKYED